MIMITIIVSIAISKPWVVVHSCVLRASKIIKTYQTISNYHPIFSRFGIVKFLIQTASIYRLMNEQHQVLIWWRSPAWRDLPPPCMRRRNMFRQSSVHMMYTVYTHIIHHNTICNVYLYSIHISLYRHTHTHAYIYNTPTIRCMSYVLCNYRYYVFMCI